MAKIDPQEKLLNLDNKPIVMEGKELTVGRALALVLVTQTKSTDPLRAYLLGKKLGDIEKAEAIELDQAETKFIQQAIAGFQGFSVLVTGQILEKLG